MILNEPETSLHADLIPPLARLIAGASERSQVLVVSHAAELVSALEAAGCRRIVLRKELSETQVETGEEDETPKWAWPAR
jgi:predicted ATPase